MRAPLWFIFTAIKATSSCLKDFEAFDRCAKLGLLDETETAAAAALAQAKQAQFLLLSSQVAF